MAVREEVNRSGSFGIPLRGSSFADVLEDRRNSWPDILSEVVQRTIRELAERRITEARGELESIVFIKSLIEAALQPGDAGYQGLSELTLFSKPIGMFSFQLQDRRYVCIRQPLPGESPVDSGFSSEGKRLGEVISRLTKIISRHATDLGSEPKNEELLVVLFNHLDEVYRGADPAKSLESVSGNGRKVMRFHSARRGAVSNWQERTEQLYQERYEHDDRRAFYCYPLVEGFVLDRTHLLLLFVSPLDKNFVDEKVSDDQRVAEIALALFDVNDLVYAGLVEKMIPLMKESFAQVLFTNMVYETTQALEASFEEQASILRYWVKLASDGLQSLINDDQSKKPFDSFTFCEAVVRQILCADIPEAGHSEVFPFDRVFIFREAGTSTQIKKERPIEMMVLEASILSNNPADRGRHLTRRERLIRNTEDYECDASKKIIKDENKIHFYIHGHSQGLILSRQSELSKELKEEAVRGVPESALTGKAESRGYLLGLPRADDESQISTALYNLFGRLIPEAHQVKPISDPAGEKGVLFDTETFNEAFERQRLTVLQRADETGLSYHYAHGLNLPLEVPLLHQLQTAYFNFLDEYFEDQDKQVRREAFRVDNLSQDKVKVLLERHDHLRQKKLHQQSKFASGHPGETPAQQRSKVVYISFSWELNDANMQMLLSQSGKEAREEEHHALLGDEYTYTMILVADRDPEKNLAQLQSERENLKLFYQMIMRQIWINKLAERNYLEKKSSIIGKSLGQFLHRAKSLLKEQEDRDSLDELFKNLKVLMRAGRPRIEEVTVSTTQAIFKKLLIDSSLDELTTELIQTKLLKLVQKWFPHQFSGGKGGQIHVLPPLNLPQLGVQWSDGVVSDAFYVAFKNACEAACLAQEGEGKQVTIQIQAVPRDLEKDRTKWFLDVVIENSGGPIQETYLAILNAADPSMMPSNNKKQGSTGAGVFLSRYQLQDVIGDGADMIISNLDNGMVQTRLRLPAELTARRVDPSGLEMDLDLGMNYVLYVEDNSKYYQEALKEMVPILEPHGLRVEHCHGSLRAIQLVEKKMPMAIITDVNILREETGTDAMANFKRFVLAVLNKAAGVNNKPPIWILSAENESGVRSSLGDVTSKGYRFVPSKKSNADSMCAPGSICFFPGFKRPGQIGAFQQLIKSLSQVADTAEPVSVGEPLSHSLVANCAHHAVSIPLRGNNFDERLRASYNSLIGGVNSVVVVETTCQGLAEVAEALTSWFGHPGQPDPDPIVGTENELYRLTDHVMHKRLVLSITVDQDNFIHIPIQLLYWGLSRNILFATPSQDAACLVNIWGNFRHESRGPLSTLRHDLSGEFSRIGQPSLLESVIKKITRCERRLLLPDMVWEKLEQLLINKEVVLPKLEELLENPGDVHRQRREVRKYLQDLDREVLELSEAGASSEHTSSRRSTLHALDNYVGGE